MNESDASGLLCVGMHETGRGQESYATECSKMNQDTSAMYTDHSSTSAFLEEYHMSEIQPLEELRFGNAQHFELQSQRMLADSEDESVPSSPDTSSTTNYDMPGYMEQNLQHIYNAYDGLIDKDGPVTLSPDFIMCDETSHLEPHLTFSSDGIKIQCLDLDLDKMITFNWGLSNIISISCKWVQSVGSALITLLAESEVENRKSGPVRVQFSLDDLQWPRKQQKIWHLGTRYQEIWKEIPSDDFSSEDWSIEPNLFFPSEYFSNTQDFEDVIYPEGDPDAVSISKRDAELLLPETFVNDTIIDFYIKYLTTRIESTEKRRYHFFNSFFFRKLADLDKDQGRALEGRAAFLCVRKWTRKINIFEKDFVFIPVNFSLHWSLIVVCYPGEVATFGDGAAKLSVKLPCILHMDSLKGSHSGLKDIIQSYLWEEWKERHPESAADNSEKFWNLRFVSLELPQQDNSFDCGLFLLHYVELFLMDVPSNFNPLKIDVFSSFLSDDWFSPAEASHKRSVIQKLIQEVVTGSFQNHPNLGCSNEQLDERHQSRNADGEPAGDCPAQSCSADQAELVCTIRDDAHGAEQSASICVNDSKEKVLSASEGMVNTGRFAMVAVQNLQESGVCLVESDTVVCLSSQDENNDTLVDMRSCGPVDGEVLKGSSGGVSYMERAESLLFTLDDNQKYSSQAEVKVQDIVVSNCCSISYNSEEVITYQENSLQRNTDEVGHKCCMPSQDMDSLVMLDSSKGDIGPNPERMTGEDDGSDLSENMGSATQGDINKDVAELKCEDSLADHITVENAIEDSVKETDTNADNINHGEQYVSSELAEGNADNGMASDISQLKHEDSLADHITVENAMEDNVKETDSNADNINHNEQYVSSKLTEGNADNGMASDISQLNVGNTEKVVTCDNAISSGLNEGSTNQIMEGVFTCETNINADGVDKHLATGGAIHHKDAMAGVVPCEDTTYTEAQDGSVPREGDTSCTDAEMPLVDRPCPIKNATVSENTTSDAKRSLLDGICEEKVIVVSDDKCTQNDDSQGAVAKRPLPDIICNEKDIVFSGDKGIQKNDVQVTDTERPLPDSLCEENVVSSDIRKDDAHSTDVKRPLPDGVCERVTAVPERSVQKDNLHSTDAKIERHYKRRKVLAAESQQERSSSGV